MLNRSTWLILGLALLAGLAGLAAGRWWFAPAGVDPASVAAPGITAADDDRRRAMLLRDLDGNPQTLDAFAGQPLIINFWATWCAPCIEELPLLDAFHARRAEDGLTVLAIALESDPALVSAFVAQHRLALPVLLSPPGGRDLSTLYNNRLGVLPFSVLLDRDGKPLAQHAGVLDPARLRDWRALAEAR